MIAPFVNDPVLSKDLLGPIPVGRIAEPREIALLALYLASEASNFVTGQTIFIDGGQLSHGAGNI
jgi:NAD(P)-dependent dehydrogenase (short-subunit alcohol dehydrogenase family)